MFATDEITSQLRTMYAPDQARIALAKKRQAQVWRHESPDKYPLLIEGAMTPKQNEMLPDPDYKEAFHCGELMLCQQIRKALSVANSQSDAVPSIQANMGCGIFLACLGVEQSIFSDKMPWLNRHLTKQKISSMTPDDIKIQGSFERGLEYIKVFKEIMGTSIAVYVMDQQGPFDLAHLLLGNELFIQLYDDPPFVHHLMDLCFELGKKCLTWCKQVAGEPLDELYHMNCLYSETMGIRICEDTTTMISEDAMHEFTLPYTKKLARHFGTAHVHYCGRNDALTKALCDIPEITGLNFGHVPGDDKNTGPERFEKDLALCKDSNTVYVGYWPPYCNESFDNYLDRLFIYASKGCLIPYIPNECIEKQCEFKDIANILEFWYQK